MKKIICFVLVFILCACAPTNINNSDGNQKDNDESMEIVMPNLDGMSIEKAIDVLASLNFHVTSDSIKYEVNLEEPFGDIISHKPSPNERINSISDIELVVSHGSNIEYYHGYDYFGYVIPDAVDSEDGKYVFYKNENDELIYYDYFYNGEKWWDSDSFQGDFPGHIKHGSGVDGTYDDVVYNDNNQIERITYSSNGSVFTYEYDDENRMVAMQTSGGYTQGKHVFEYYDNVVVEKVVEGNDVCELETGIVAEYEFDEVGRLIKVVYPAYGGAPKHSNTYHYD